MSARFADSTFYVALLDRNDPAHTRAVEWFQVKDSLLVTTRWVLMEVADVLRGVHARRVAALLLDRVESDASTLLVEPNREIYLRALDLYDRETRREWSLGDCLSLLVMRDHGLTESLSTRPSFSEAGFKALLA